MAKKIKGVTLPELLAYADQHKCEFSEAADHFTAIGRMKPAEQRQVPDGYTIPPHRFVLTAQAVARAGADQDAVLAACERELEGLMLETVRSGGEGKGFTFAFHCFPHGQDGYESGFTLVPGKSGVINVDASEFQAVDDVGEMAVKMPMIDL